MDSIEKMRRLNNLTKELKQHGFAESSFEAIQQANQIYGDDEVSHDVKHGIIRSSNGDRMAESTENIDINNSAHKKIAQLSENVDTLTAKMNEIIKALNDLDARIIELKNRSPEKVIVEKFIERPIPNMPRETREETTPEVHHEEKKEETVVGHVHKEEYTANQRTGNFQPNDVAIDKMFYFGKK